MGCNTSKPIENGRPPPGQDPTRNTGVDRRSIVSSHANFDKKLTEESKRKLENEPDKFVLNNMLLSIMFFNSYKELEPFRAKFIETKSETTNLRNHNTTLLSENKMIQIEPDCILEIVNKYVSYRPKHGPKKSVSEPLAARRIFLIDDRVEIVSLDDEDTLNEYDTVDKPRYQFSIEFTKRKGFVKFIFKEDSYDEEDQLIESKEELQTGQQSEDEIYKEVTYSRTPKPIGGGKLDMKRRDTNLPRACFKKIAEKNEYDEIDETIKPKTYLDSKMYMKHFKDSSFHIAAETLEFSEKDIESADYIAGKVLCTKEEVPWEIIPAVTIEWPTTYTYDFVDREERPVRTFINTGKHVQWPKDRVIQDIIKTKAVAIPKGYTPKKGKNPESDIEWEICFPKAEHILQCTMNHCQMRCYLYLLAIHKHFIEPKTKQQGLLAEHIKTHMFWEMETTFNWSDIDIYNKLYKIIEKLVDRLGCKTLPDYFIKQRNLFENIPSHYLFHAQEVFHGILQRPLMRMLSVLRNVQYNYNDFYPTFDFDELHKNLIKKVEVQPYAKGRKRNVSNKKNATNLEEAKDKKKDSIDSIDLDWKPTEDLTFVKRREILTMFIKNFMGIITKSMQVSTNQQTIRYCKLATYLTNIYSQLYPSEIERVESFRKDIQRYEEKAKIILSKIARNTPPTPPVVRPRSLYIKSNTTKTRTSYSEENISPTIHTKIVSFNLDSDADSSSSTPVRSVNFNFDDVDNRVDTSEIDIVV